MNKKGFTLIELLITIALIGVLGVIAVGTIMNSVGSAKSDLSDYQKDILKKTAEFYFEEEIYTTDKNPYIVCIQEDLVANGYLDEYKDSDGNLILGEIDLSISSINGTIKVSAGDIREGEEDSCSSGEE